MCEMCVCGWVCAHRVVSGAVICLVSPRFVCEARQNCRAHLRHQAQGKEKSGFDQLPCEGVVFSPLPAVVAVAVIARKQDGNTAGLDRLKEAWRPVRPTLRAEAKHLRGDNRRLWRRRLYA